MRYLKTFENLNYFTSGVNEIETFIKNNIAYILDEGFTYKVNFQKYNDRFNYPVRIHKVEQKDNTRKQLIFDWVNIKDDLIPFLELLNDTYTLESYSLEDKSLVIDTGEIKTNWPTFGTKKRWYSIEDLINDTIGDHIKFQFISFVITGEK